MFDLFIICFFANVLSLVCVVVLFLILAFIQRKKRINSTK